MTNFSKKPPDNRDVEALKSLLESRQLSMKDLYIQVNQSTRELVEEVRPSNRADRVYELLRPLYLMQEWLEKVLGD